MYHGTAAKKMFSSSFRTPSFLNASTSARSDMPLPRSTTIGLYPFLAAPKTNNIRTDKSYDNWTIRFSLQVSRANFHLCTLHMLCNSRWHLHSWPPKIHGTYTMKIPFDLSLHLSNSRAGHLPVAALSEAFKDSCWSFLAGKSVISSTEAASPNHGMNIYQASPPRHTLSTILVSILCASSLCFNCFPEPYSPGLHAVDTDAPARFPDRNAWFGFIHRKSHHNLGETSPTIYEFALGAVQAALINSFCSSPPGVLLPALSEPVGSDRALALATAYLLLLLMEDRLESLHLL